ncbi:MAG: selenocysteine-specific translation elongation factor [Deltaproteobacteria bacterium]|nr:selenocysteine-specific translation elongation factor [Deltaproteobacteria bacterium]
MKQIILGTAGHIDHGKTSLIKALTGIDTDRLKEEKARGITIELGFAHLKLPSGEVIGIIDVPGHEKFVKNMVAGATGIDLVALIIAADEGVMPQTREHLEICQLLKIKHGLVVLTKKDMVDNEWLDLVKEDISEFLSGSFLEDAPVITVSSVTGDGLDNLLSELDRLIRIIPEREQGNFFRLPIDRIFTMKGFGTVVTGTAVSGDIMVGDEVTVYPTGIPSKIRGIQVHGQEMEKVRAGLRTAINLQGVEKVNIQRGDVLAARDSLMRSFMIDAVLDLLSTSPRKLKNRAKVRFHSGTSEIISTLILLDREELNPGESCFAQIRLDQPTVLLQGDRYILRSYSPVRTIGGGIVLNALPGKKKRFSKDVLAELKILMDAELEKRVEQFIFMGRFRGAENKKLQFLANTSGKELDGVLKGLLAKKVVYQYNKENGSIIHSHFLQKAIEEITAILGEYHERFPLKIGLQKEELRSRSIRANEQKLFNYIINRLIRDSVIIQEKELLRLKSHRVMLARDQEKTRDLIEEIYLKGGLQPPYFKELRDKFPDGAVDDVLQVMVKNGILHKIKEDLYFHNQHIDVLEGRLTAYLKENDEITTPQFKEMTGTSRKYTIPLLEYFDRSGVTVRVGDNRLLRKK